MDGSFAPAKKGATESEKPSGVRGRSGWWWSDGQGVPLGDYLHSASPAEVKLVEKTLAAIRVRRRHRAGRPRQKPERMIMDRGYDSDGLRRQLRRLGIEPIIPHRKGRRKPSMQDGRALRRYKKALDRRAARSPGWATSADCALRPFR